MVRAQIASIGSVDSNGSILTVNIVQSGSGYQSNDIIAVFPANGTGASLTANLFSTGKIHSAEITNGGENFSTAPTILISDTGGNGGAISASLGDITTTRWMYYRITRRKLPTRRIQD